MYSMCAASRRQKQGIENGISIIFGNERISFFPLLFLSLSRCCRSECATDVHRIQMCLFLTYLQFSILFDSMFTGVYIPPWRRLFWLNNIKSVFLYMGDVRCASHWLTQQRASCNIHEYIWVSDYTLSLSLTFFNILSLCVTRCFSQSLHSISLLFMYYSLNVEFHRFILNGPLNPVHFILQVPLR